MTIQPFGASAPYKAYASASKGSESKPAQRVSPADRQDRLELSPDGAKAAQPLKSLAAQLSREMDAGASAERLAALKKSADNGSCPVPGDVLADSILGI